MVPSYSSLAAHKSKPQRLKCNQYKRIACRNFSEVSKPFQTAQLEASPAVTCEIQPFTEIPKACAGHVEVLQCSLCQDPWQLSSPALPRVCLNPQQQGKGLLG